jgi:crossover junction endodeoxyribonuclease RuvC
VGYACLETLEESGASSGPPGIKNLVRPRFKGSSADLRDAGVWRLGGRQASIPQRLHALALALRQRIDAFEPDVIAVEGAFYGKSVQSALRLGEARGAILLVAAERGIQAEEYAPALVKRRVTGHGSASKESVSRILAQEFGAQVNELPLDASDALAIAWCHVQEERSRSWRSLGQGR